MNTLITERLILRHFVLEDWRDLQRLAQCFMASPMRVYDHQWLLDDASIQKICEQFVLQPDYYVVLNRQDKAFLGFVCLNGELGALSLDMGYNFLAEGQGRGYATEACRAVMAHAFDTLGAERLTAGTAQANGPSRRLLARLGFVKMGEELVSFTQDERGNPIEFVGYAFDLPRERYVEGQKP